MFSPMAFVKRPLVLTYQGETEDTADGTVFTFAGEAIGTAAADRRVHVLIGASGNVGTITGVTIGGITAAITVQAQDGSAKAGIATALVPTGTTASVVITFDATQGRCHIGVFSSTGLSSNTPLDTGTSTADPATDTLASAPGGFCLALGVSVATTTVAWTAITEQYDVQVEATATMSGASIVTTGATVSPSGDYAAPGADAIAVFATW